MIQKETVRKLAQERIDERFPEVFIVEISISAKNTINVELDKMNSYVSIEECVAVSRNIEHNLDREQQDFELHVSSAGLDKPLRVLAQFEKNIGREVDVVMKEGEKLSGTLIAADDKNLTLENIADGKAGRQQEKGKNHRAVRSADEQDKRNKNCYFI